MSRLADRSRRRGRVLALACAAALLAPLTLVSAPAHAARAVRATAAPTASPRVVTLPTGLRVAVSTTGTHTSVAALPRAGADSRFATATFGGSTYVIPAAASSSVGSRYALDDFLVRGTGQQPAAPAFRQYTVTIDAFTRTGRPSAGDLLFVQNEDDGRAPLLAVVTEHGRAKVSLPAGHYFLAGFFFSGTTQPVVSFPMLNDAKVAGPGTTLTLDARTATVAPTVRTPEPSTVVDQELTITRLAQSHRETSVFGLGGGAAPIYVTPVTSPVRYGSLSYDVYLRSVGDGYLYDADYLGTHDDPVPAVQVYATPASSYATLNSRYFSDGGTSTAVDARFDFTPTTTFESRELEPLSRPAARTEYVLADPRLQWQQQIVAVPASFAGFAVSGGDYYTPGEIVPNDWFRQPAHPAPALPTGGICPACRTGDALLISYLDFADTDSDHITYLDPPGVPGLDESVSFSVREGGTLLYRAPTMYTELTGLSPKPTTYTLREVTHRSGDGYELAPDTDTTWTVPSGSDDGLPVPARQVCVLSGGTCRALPVITPGYDLPVSLDGSIPAGPTTVGLDLRAPTGAPFPGLTSVQVAVSFDGGATSAPATVTRTSAGAYAASYNAPSPTETDGYATLVVTARADDGAAVRQTIDHAYRVAPGLADADDAVAEGSVAEGSVPAPCATAASGDAHCDARIAVGATRPATATQVRAAGTAALPQGYGPADLQAAYRLPSTGGAGRTVGIVDAFSDPRAASDLAAYRRTYRLPACTEASGCLRIVDQRGGTALPPADPGWAAEISLDLDAVSATCPTCHLLLVEGDDNSMADLAASVDEAVRLGADAVSNSYGSDEFGGMGALARDYDHPGTAITVSSGDDSFGVAQFPAVLRTVTAVGGTTLEDEDGHYTSTAWSGAGSGCSAYVVKPAWQTDRHCSMRTTSDISTVADPDTGLAVYDSYETGYPTDWLVFGGTSASSPVVAAMYVLAGRTAGVHGAAGLYAHRSSITDVRGGSNGYCGGDYLCTATKGYDGPTGLGSPAGLGAFR